MEHKRGSSDELGDIIKLLMIVKLLSVILHLLK
jgi:hypothetical protein